MASIACVFVANPPQSLEQETISAVCQLLAVDSYVDVPLLDRRPGSTMQVAFFSAHNYPLVSHFNAAVPISGDPLSLIMVTFATRS